MLTAAAILGILSIFLANEQEITTMIREQEALERETETYAQEYHERRMVELRQLPESRAEQSTLIMVQGKAERTVLDETVQPRHNFTDRR